MSLFRRRREPARHSTDEPAEDELDTTPDDSLDDEATDDAAEDESEAPTGPFDADDAPDDEYERVDLGALKIPAVPGVEVQMQVDEQGVIRMVTFMAGASRARITASAAPRTEGIWDEMRAELAGQLRADGGTVREQDGPYGTELIGRVQTDAGRQPVRFIGIDGPRWFVHAMFLGAAASDPAAAPELDLTIRNLVVERGPEAMPVRESLPLRLPPDAAAAQQEAEADGTDGRPVPDR